MAFYDTPITKLDAVNICLNSIGESSIASLTGCPPDAQLAADLIDEKARGIQNAGWHWNRQTVTLTPDINGYLILPNNISRVVTSGVSVMYDLVQRGTKLYDRKNNTFVFPAGSSYEVDMYILLSFEDMVPQAKDFVTYAAAMVFQQRIHASDTEDKFLKEAAQQALIQLKRAEHSVGRPNMLRDNWSSACIVQRGMFNRGAYNSWV
jgi:hypothetical protein